MNYNATLFLPREMCACSFREEEQSECLTSQCDFITPRALEAIILDPGSSPLTIGAEGLYQTLNGFDNFPTLIFF